MDLLLSELNENSLPSMSGQRLRARAASQSAINDAHTAFLISKSSINPPTSSNITRADSTSSNPSFLSAPDPRQKDACRTLYVGNLDKHCKEEILRARFNFGHILELDIKNRDSFSPFAFIQFTDIMAVVNAITANQNNRLDISGLKSDRNGKIKTNFGKPMPSCKLWIASLPRSCSQEYLLFCLRNISSDGVQEVNYDAVHQEALVIFRNAEYAQIVYSKIKSRTFVIPPEKPQKDSQSLVQQVDFASDKLHEFFVDRKNGQIRNTDLSIDSLNSQSESRKPHELERFNTIRESETNVPQALQSTARLQTSKESESLLAPPPDPPLNLISAETVEEVENMSSRHNRRSSSRRSSPDSSWHKRDRDRDRYERRSDSRSYKSRHHDKKYHKKRDDSRHDSRHSYRSNSSSSSTSSTSNSSRTNMSSSSSSSSRASTSPRSVSRKLASTSSPIISAPTIQSMSLGHSPFTQPPPIPPSISKVQNLAVPLKRSEAIDTTNFPASTSMDSESRSTTLQTGIQSKSSIQPPKSAPVSMVSTKLDFKVSSSQPHHYRGQPSRTPLNIPTEACQSHKDPRLSSESYNSHILSDHEPSIRFPTFFVEDELGKHYCQRMNSLTERRNSQPLTSSIRQRSSVDFTTHHPPISRSSSGSDHPKTPANLSEITSAGLPFDMPLVPPYPPPPLGTPLESPLSIELLRQRSDSIADTSSFSEKLQSLTSKVSSIYERHQTQQRTSTFDHDPQQLFKLKKASLTKSCDSSQSTTPTSRLSEGPKTSISSGANRLTINIPTSTSNSSTPMIGSPAIQPYLTQSPAANLTQNSGRSMSFTQQNSQISAETQSTTYMTQRSMSYGFANTTSPAGLPLPPQPPTLQMTSPQTEKILSPRFNPMPKSTSMISPTGSNLSTGGSNQLKSEITPTLSIKQTAVAKSTVTSPLTTPSTPRSASSVPSSDSKPSINTKESVEMSEEARRKKQDEKMKLFQSIRVPKKPRDSTVEEIFSFSSPLSRPPHNQQVTTPHTIPPNPLAAAKNKPIEKPVVKSQIPTINRSSTQTSLHKKDKVFKDEKLKTSKSSLSILPTKTELKHGKPSVLSGLSEKNRRNSEILIENEMKKVREKAARKFPTDEKEREKYIRKKQKKLKQRVEEVFGQTDTKKEVTAKKSDDIQRKFQQKTSEQRLSIHSKPKESSREKEIKALKDKSKEKQRDSVERIKQQKKTSRNRQRTPSESESDDESEEDNSSEILAECGLKNIDLEMQRILFEEAKSGQLNLSMYERVRRRRMATQSDENKKNQALEILRENKKKEKKPKRVQLSSDDDSDAVDSHKPPKESASDNSDSEHSEASTALSSSSALQRKANAKKLAKSESRKKDKPKKSGIERASTSKKLSMKKLTKKDEDDSDESDTLSSTSKPQKSAIKKASTESSEESNDERAVKKLKKNLSAYNKDSDESDSDSAKHRPKNKLKSKKTALLIDDDFCADSDEDKRNGETKREATRIYTGKPGRPRETLKNIGDKLTKHGKMDENRLKKVKDSAKLEAKKSAKKSKQKEDEVDEPLKKKSKISIKAEESEKKRRASSDIESAPIIKRQKPFKLLSLEHQPKMFPSLDDFSGIDMSPIQTTSTDNVRLENFVTQSCSNQSPLILPLENRRFVSGNTENNEFSTQHKRTRTSSSSSTASSSSSTYSYTSSATVATKKSTLSRQPSDTSTKTAETNASKLHTFHFVKPIDETTAKTSSVLSEKVTETVGSDIKEAKKATLALLEDLNSPANLEESDEDVDYEALLISKLNQKDVPKDVSVENAEIAQETEDAVESISALMNANQQRSDDEQEEAFTLIDNFRSKTSPTQTTSTDRVWLENFVPETSNQLPLISPKKESSPQQHVCPPDPAPTVSKAEPSFSSGQISPISSVIESIAHGTPFTVENSVPETKPVEQKPQQIASTIASSIPTHIPTPPPSRSSGGSPVTQLAYPARQQSPLVASKSAQQIEVTQKRLSDGAIQAPTVSQNQPPKNAPSVQAQTVFMPEVSSSLISSGSIQLPPNMAQIQQQLMAQRGSLSEQELLSLANEMAKKQIVHPNVIQQSLFNQPMSTQQRMRVGSQGIVGVPQRKSGNMTASSMPQQLNTTRTTNTSQLPPTNTQTVMPQNTDLAYISQLSQILSMHPGLNNQIVMQQLLNSPQFLAQIPYLANDRQLLEQFLQRFQANQQNTELENITKQVMQMVGPNASPQNVQQTILSLIQQEQQARQQQEKEFVEKQLMLSRYETACRENRMLADDLARRQVLQHHMPQVTSATQIPPPNKRFDENRFPICWQGVLALKSNGTRVQMHHISGNQLLMESTRNELAAQAEDGFPTIRITQRMRLQNPHMISVCNKMNDENEFVAMICFPCGQNAEQVSQQTTKMTSTFIDYFTSKMAAGVVTRTPHAPHPTCVAHVFPPCDFSAAQLKRFAPEMLEEIQRLHSTYLFIVVTRNDGNGIPHDAEKVHMMPVISQAIGKTV